MQVCFWKACSEMSNADRLDARRGGWRSRPMASAGDLWVAWIGMPSLRDIVRDYVIEHFGG